ncbi:MAG: CBS domain-containing protein [Chloroflexi bacterium]|nr:MAG: CBS domain-containing protein [Chloroflexota bacterium]
MQLHGKAKRVVIYIGERDRFGGQPLYMALLEMLKKEGAAGATVVRGIAGFGAHSRIHTASIMALSEDLPLRLEWIDTPQKVAQLLPRVRRMVDDGLITVEEIEVVQYAAGRRTDPLAQQVGEVMRQDVVTVRPDTPVAELVRLLLTEGYRSVPVVAENGRLSGLITDGDLLRRVGLTTRLDLQETLPAETIRTQFARWQSEKLTAKDIMTTSLITIRPSSLLREAVEKMVTHGLKRLPVVDEADRIVGWISRVDILRNIEYHHPVSATEHMPPRQGKTISELMYKDVPVVLPTAKLEEILQAIERTQRRRVVVVDEERRVLGIITDGDILRRSQRRQHTGLWQRLRAVIAGEERPLVTLPDAQETAADLMSAPVITVQENVPLPEALRLMLQHGIKRVPVVDENGRLVGLLGRGSLLQGLLR